MKAVFLFLVLGCFALVGAYEFSGDMVFVNDSRVFLGAAPHTITGTADVLFNLTSKVYNGNVDLAFGFDSDAVRPLGAWVYAPYYTNVTHSFDCPAPNWFNYTLAPKVFYCWTPNATNGTTVLIASHWFEWANASAAIAFWNESQWNYGNDVSSRFVKADFSFGGMDRWFYVRNIAVVQGVNYQLKVRLQVQPVLGGGGQRKYFVALKPSIETLAEARDAGHLYYLDPWFNNTFQNCSDFTAAGIPTDNNSIVRLGVNCGDYSCPYLRFVNTTCGNGGVEWGAVADNCTADNTFCNFTTTDWGGNLSAVWGNTTSVGYGALPHGLEWHDEFNGSAFNDTGAAWAGLADCSSVTIKNGMVDMSCTDTSGTGVLTQRTFVRSDLTFQVQMQVDSGPGSQFVFAYKSGANQNYFGFFPDANTVRYYSSVGADLQTYTGTTWLPNTLYDFFMHGNTTLAHSSVGNYSIVYISNINWQAGDRNFMIGGIISGAASGFDYAFARAWYSTNFTVVPRKFTQGPVQHPAGADTTAPNVSLVSPAVGALVGNRSNLFFNFTAVDEASVLMNATLYWNVTGTWLANVTNETGLLNGSAFYLNATPSAFGGGAILWNVRVCDSAGNCAFNSSNRSFYWDRVFPNVTLSSPANGTVQLNSTPYLAFYFNASDDHGLLNATLWSNFSGAWAANVSNTSVLNNTVTLLNVSFGGLAPGVYRWSVFACDNASNCGFGGAVNYSVVLQAAGTFNLKALPFGLFPAAIKLRDFADLAGYWSGSCNLSNYWVEDNFTNTFVNESNHSFTGLNNSWGNASVYFPTYGDFVLRLWATCAGVGSNYSALRVYVDYSGVGGVGVGGGGAPPGGNPTVSPTPVVSPSASPSPQAFVWPAALLWLDGLFKGTWLGVSLAAVFGGLFIITAFLVQEKKKKESEDGDKWEYGFGAASWVCFVVGLFLVVYYSGFIFA